MKKNDFVEIRNANLTELSKKILAAQTAVADLVMDKNMGKLKDLKAVMKKKKDIAQMKTVFNQKHLLGELEEKIEEKADKGGSKKS